MPPRSFPHDTASSITPTEVPEGRRRSFDDLGMRTKVMSIGVIVGLVAVAVGTSGLTAMSAMSAGAAAISGNAASGIAIAEVKAVVNQLRVDVANQAISADRASTEKYTAATNADIAAVDVAFAAYRATDPAGDPVVLAALQADVGAYVELVRTRQLPAGAKYDLATWRKNRDTVAAPLFAKIQENVSTLAAAERGNATATAAAARSRYESSRTTSLLLLGVGLLIGLGAAWWVAGGIVRSLRRVEEVCDSLAAGDLTRTTGLTSSDELGTMGRALDSAMSTLRRTVSTISTSATSLAAATEQVHGVSARISASAEETSVQAQAVSAAAEQISRSVETVTAGGDEMGASIREISQNATEAARVAAEAVAVTAATSTTMGRLGDSSAEIGNVIKVINAIAAQTNLLALNATIEAARAGDAGKGFAVVAAEVKDLAQETARATEDISKRVQAIQSDTTGAVTAIDEISQVIGRINDFQTTIASAVEEQTATTAEMNRSVAEAAMGTNEVAQNITGVADAAQITSVGIAESQRATTDLARMSGELTALVAKFRY